uniref:Solute carrier family 4 member 11 n=1 Tax=Cyprinus carpio TaxID=7962 RepID=A0A8C1ICY7_CYPCA
VSENEYSSGRLSYVKLVDFPEELRAHRDLDGFLAQVSILLDVRASSLDEVRRMLEHVATDGQGSCNAEEFMSALFTDAGGQETIECMTVTATGVHYQQSWLCVLCNVKSLQRACVCVSHLERLQNWGVNRCEVCYVILILAPPLTVSPSQIYLNLFCIFVGVFCGLFVYSFVKDFLRAGRGIYGDLCRRLLLYLSNFTDDESLLKYTTTAIFLCIAILLPAIAFGSLNDESTRGEIDVQKTVIGQSIGGVIYSFLIFLLALQASVMTMTLIFLLFMPATASGTVSMFLILGSIFNISLFMKLFKCSTEEVIALFISIAFVGDALKGLFHKHYHGLTLINGSTEELHGLGVILHQTVNTTENRGVSLPAAMVLCTRESPILCLLLMLGTLWLGYALFLIKRRSSGLTVITISFPVFNYQNEALFKVAAFDELTGLNVLSACGLGFLLALLIFTDQNIVVSLTNAPENRLLKGTAYPWDLMLSGFINILMSVLGLPWMHAAFPHSTLHVRQLARVERRVEGAISMKLFLLLVPLQWVPKPALYGLFLYIALMSIDGNQMCDRMALLLKEQCRRGRCIISQAFILCAFGMYPPPYMKMIFPLLMIILIPIRGKNLLPMIIEAKCLDIIDSQHM